VNTLRTKKGKIMKYTAFGGKKKTEVVQHVLKNPVSIFLD
jgi:hypothetical protein